MSTAVDNAIKNFVRDSEHQKDKSTTYYGWIWKDGRLNDQGGGCHGGLSTGQSLKDLEYVIISHQKRRDGLTKEDGEIFVDWFVNKSPYSKYIVNEDRSPKTIEGNYFLIDPSTPGNLLLGAAITSRYTTEGVFTLSAKTMMYLIKEMNVNPTIAYIFSHFYTPNNIKNIFPLLFKNAPPVHTATNFNHQTKKYIQNFISGKPVNVNSPYNKSGNYSGVCNTWGTGGYNTSNSENALFVRNLKPKLGVLKKNYNIFDIVRKSGEGYQIRNNEELRNMLDQFQEWIIS